MSRGPPRHVNEATKRARAAVPDRKAGELPALSRAYEAMNDAVAACCGFPEGVWRDEKETLRLLLQLNQTIARPMGLSG